MKYFISGDIRRENGPRLILSITLLFFLAFLGANATLLHLQSGLLPERIAELSENSLTIRIERAHLQLFLFLVLNLFTSSLLFRLLPTQKSARRNRWAGRLTMSGAIMTVVYLGLFIWPIAVPFSAAAIGLHAWFACLISFLLFDLLADHQKLHHRDPSEIPSTLRTEGTAQPRKAGKEPFPASILLTLFGLAFLLAASGATMFLLKVGWHPAGIIEYYRGSDVMLQHFTDYEDHFRSAPDVPGRLEIVFAHTFAYALLGFLLLHLLIAGRGDTGPSRTSTNRAPHRNARWIAAAYFASAGADLSVEVLLPFTPWWFALFKLPFHIAFVGSCLAILFLCLRALMDRKRPLPEATFSNATGDLPTE